MVSNAFGYAGVTSVVSVMALLASNIVGGDSWAGLPAAAATIGTAAMATRWRCAPGERDDASDSPSGTCLAHSGASVS